MFEKIKERYLKRYIRNDQLDRYVKLGAITAEQAQMIRREVQQNDQEST